VIRTPWLRAVFPEGTVVQFSPPFLTGPATFTIESDLTDQPWLLLSYGYDKNNNGEVESNEENIRDCDKDNTYTFKKDGSGIVNENAMICDGNKQREEFSWALAENDTTLDFYFATAHIVELSEKRLRITNAGNDPEKLMLVYGH